MLFCKARHTVRFMRVLSAAHAWQRVLLSCSYGETFGQGDCFDELLARQCLAWHTRDVLASQAITLRDRNHSLAESLEQLQAQADAVEPHDDAAVAQQRPAPFACLTEREYEVARLVAKGLDNREIAATAFLSEGTVRNNISSILSKMDLKNRTQIAVAWWSGAADHR